MSCSITIADPPGPLLPRNLFSRVDAVSACEPDARLLAHKLVVHNAPSVRSRFPDDPVMPDLRLVASLAEDGEHRLPTTRDHAARTVVDFASLGQASCHWHTTVRSDGNLRLRVIVTRRDGALRTVRAESRVEVEAVTVAGALVCEDELDALVAAR